MARIAFDRSPAFSDRGVPPIPTPEEYNARHPLDAASSPASVGGYDRMTYDDVLAKTGLSFLVLLAGVGVGWFVPGLFLPAMIAGFVYHYIWG